MSAGTNTPPIPFAEALSIMTLVYQSQNDKEVLPQQVFRDETGSVTGTLHSWKGRGQRWSLACGGWHYTCGLGSTSSKLLFSSGLPASKALKVFHRHPTTSLVLIFN